jgi:hypothetical protein
VSLKLEEHLKKPVSDAAGKAGETSAPSQLTSEEKERLQNVVHVISGTIPINLYLEFMFR